MVIKVCGMRDGDNICSVEEARPDMMGFICWAGSARKVSSRPSHLPACHRVGVFVNPTMQQVLAAKEMLNLTTCNCMAMKRLHYAMSSKGQQVCNLSKL